MPTHANHEEEEEEMPLESHISKKLSDRTTKIVIIIVLVMLFSQQGFDPNTYIDSPNYSDQAIIHMIDMY